MRSVHHIRHEDHFVSLCAYAQLHGVQVFYSQTVKVEVKLAVLALKACDVC